jgi:hypothetical protein
MLRAPGEYFIFATIMEKISKLALTVVSLLALFAMGGKYSVLADEITKWNETASKAAFDSGLSDPPRSIPFFEARIYTVAHVAIHDALNAIDRQYQSYTLKKRAEPGASPQAAVATAASNCNDQSPVTRSYTSFFQAANEGGLSRIFIGFHFRKAIESGSKHGRKIGDHAVNHFLRPVEKKGAYE